MSFTAKWPGVCAACDEGFPAGAEVEYDSDRQLMHVLCPDDMGFDGKSRPVCPQCFMVMPTTGRCDCRD